MLIVNYSGDELRRAMGLPILWSTIFGWLNPAKTEVINIKSKDQDFDRKHKEIPVLDDYEKDPGENFWNRFPSYFPKNVIKNVKIRVLKKLVQKCWFDFTLPQRRVAKKALRWLSGTEEVKMKYELPGVKTKNAKSAIENGLHITDALAGWIKAGFVAGPFAQPPLKKLRVNPLMAAVQKTKVRPILNLSAPKGHSFNDAVDLFGVDKLKMSSAKLFAEAIIKAGQGAIMAKTDIKDAYKLIPNAKTQRRLYGFRWLNKYFLTDPRYLEAKQLQPVLTVYLKPL